MLFLRSIALRRKLLSHRVLFLEGAQLLASDCCPICGASSRLCCTGGVQKDHRDGTAVLFYGVRKQRCFPCPLSLYRGFVPSFPSSDVCRPKVVSADREKQLLESFRRSLPYRSSASRRAHCYGKIERRKPPSWGSSNMSHLSYASISTLVVLPRAVVLKRVSTSIASRKP